jgi:hypothetical protein
VEGVGKEELDEGAKMEGLDYAKKVGRAVVERIELHDDEFQMVAELAVNQNDLLRYIGVSVLHRMLLHSKTILSETHSNLEFLTFLLTLYAQEVNAFVKCTLTLCIVHIIQVSYVNTDLLNKVLSNFNLPEKVIATIKQILLRGVTSNEIDLLESSMYLI